MIMNLDRATPERENILTATYPGNTGTRYVEALVVYSCGHCFATDDKGVPIMTSIDGEIDTEHHDTKDGICDMCTTLLKTPEFIRHGLSCYTSCCMMGDESEVELQHKHVNSAMISMAAMVRSMQDTCGFSPHLDGDVLEDLINEVRGTNPSTDSMLDGLSTLDCDLCKSIGRYMFLSAYASWDEGNPTVCVRRMYTLYVSTLADAMLDSRWALGMGAAMRQTANIVECPPKWPHFGVDYRTFRNQPMDFAPPVELDYSSSEGCDDISFHE